MFKRVFNAILAFFATGTVAAQAEPLSVLFIGNSYTHMNDMPKMFDKISKDAGMNVYVEKCAQSGASFKVHADERPEVYEAIKSRKWDYVILQGYSRELTFEPAYLDTATIPYLNKLTDSIYKNDPCTNVLFYMTWGYESGYGEREETNTYDKMAMKIEAGYRYLGDKYKVPVVPVGMVWKDLKESSSIDLYASDRAHPSKEGSYLIASSFFESIFGVAQNEKIGIIREKKARQIRESVYKVICDKREYYKLDTNQIFLETSFRENKFFLNYSATSMNAESMVWHFDEEETREGDSGVFVFEGEKGDILKVRVEVTTKCGKTRVYHREVRLQKVALRNRKEQDEEE